MKKILTGILLMALAFNASAQEIVKTGLGKNGLIGRKICGPGA